ncbi:type I asparaginase [Agriterribacter sp.]|uniref:asparaginase n=1 Tax=Agriterribacter sp. TaxID=2821509 RepID=UPI002BEDAC96|nr:type I asparaginase [Agriterribacter sp.]HTN07160.1 type I asparaginase [Agriterribacter sp.]
MASSPGAKLFIIYTGGTIGMAFDDATGALVPMGFREIKYHIPEIAKLGYTFDMHAFHPPIDSSNMSPEIWIELANIIHTHYANYDGFIILHGSDTMAFTASALSFMLENLAKPVILTGSQLPMGEIRTDAKENIITTMEIAAAKKNGKARVPEVCIYFDYYLFRGNRTKKYNTETFEAFHSFNYPSLAEAGIDIKYSDQLILKYPQEPFRINTRLNADIAVLKMFPGITPHTVNAVLQTRQLKAVILETFGNGNTITAPWFIDALKQAVQEGIIVLDRTQCDGGSVELGRYATSAHLLEIGVVSAHDMTFEAAVTKLMVLLGQELTVEKVKQLLGTSLKGELTEK